MSLRASTQMIPFVVTPQDYDPALNVLGTQVTLLASKAATQSYEITLQQGDEGMGPPLHSHNWDESFFVLKGQIEFSCADKPNSACPARSCMYPRVRSTAFAMGSAAARCWNSPAQAAWHPKCSLPSSREIPPGPPDIPKVVEVLQQNGVTVGA